MHSTMDIISQKLPILCHRKTLKNDLGNIILNQLNLNIINCPKLGKIFLEKSKKCLIKLKVHNWCTQVNKIMSGKMRLTPLK